MLMCIYVHKSISTKVGIYPCSYVFVYAFMYAYIDMHLFAYFHESSNKFRQKSHQWQPPKHMPSPAKGF